MSDTRLSQEKRAELQSAFRGANSLLFLFIYLLISLLPVIWLYSKMTGWLQVMGLVLLSLFTAFILMLFLSGILKLALKQLFMMLSSDYRLLFKEESGHDRD